MNKNTSSQASLDASYVMNPANGKIKVVVKTTKELELETVVHATYVKTHYSIDSNGGGYTGL